MREIAHAASFGVAVHEDGRVRAWGLLPEGIDVGGERVLFRPTIVSGFTDIQTIDAGGAHAVGVRNDGTVWLWGSAKLVGYDGPTFADPAQVAGIQDAVWARAGWARTFVQVSDGSVLGLGGVDGRGVLGDGVAVPADQPVPIPELQGVLDIRLGNGHGLGLRADGTVLSWGSDSTGQLGDPTTTGRFRPELMPGLDSVVAIAACFESSMAVRADGSVWIWGRTQGLIPDEQDFGNARVPYRVEGLEQVIAVACRSGNMYALNADGVLFAWGAGGGIADGNPDLRTTPVPCGIRNVLRVYAGSPGVQVLTGDGGRFAWAGTHVIPGGRGDGGGGFAPLPRWPVPIYSR